MKRLTLLAALCITGSALAVPPTQAWRRIFNTTPYDDTAGGIDVDASGYAYLEYVDAEPGHFGAWYVHVVKIGPTSGIYFDKLITYSTNYAPLGVLVSPMVAGKQYVYTVTAPVGLTSQSVYIYKWDTAGNLQWNGAPLIIPDCGGLAGMYADASGNLLLAAKKGSGLTRYLGMMMVDSSGAVLGSQSNNSIYPSKAFYSPVLNGWIVAGVDMSWSDSGARWGLFNPTNGAEGTPGEIADGYTNANSSLSYTFVLSPLPNNAYGIVTNSFSYDNLGTRWYTKMQVYAANGVPVWHYPDSGTREGQIFQLAAFNSSSPIYDVGFIPATPGNTVEDFNGLGVLQWQHTNQPADTLFPWSDGFFTVFYNYANNTEFLEHANAAGVYDWGKSYVGTGTGINSFGAFRGFQNSFYIVNTISNTTTGKDVVVDRFVTGIAMQSIGAASATVQAGHSLTATIKLNGNAPTGGVAVGVTTSNNKLLLPNGTQGQYVTVPAGQLSTTVTLNAQSVTANTPVRILAIQNGIRRYVDVTVTP